MSTPLPTRAAIIKQLNEPLKEGWSDTKESQPPVQGSLEWLRMEQIKAARTRIADKQYMDQIPDIKKEKFPEAPNQILAPPPVQHFFDIPLGDPSDPVRASIPFGISEADYDLLIRTLELFKERLIRKL